MRGTRVQAIIRELRGEKIDIVEWSEDPVTFVTKALSPARVQRVTIVDEEQRVMEVVVEDRQLSLAIGKKGQNVRLAAKLAGWKIDIKSEEDKRKEVELQLEGLEFEPATEAPRPLSLPEIHVEVVAALTAAGYDSVEKVLAAGSEALGELPGFDPETVEAVLTAAGVEQTTIDRELAERAAEAAEAATEAAEAGVAGEGEGGSEAVAGEAAASEAATEAIEAVADEAAAGAAPVGAEETEPGPETDAAAGVESDPDQRPRTDDDEDTTAVAGTSPEGDTSAGNGTKSD
jgi:N utilization substance protein A